jgi:hypothetical protein
VHVQVAEAVGAQEAGLAPAAVKLTLAKKDREEGLRNSGNKNGTQRREKNGGKNHVSVAS